MQIKGVNIALTAIVITVCVLSFQTVGATSSDPLASQGSSSVAFNSDGKGEVMVSCNGKVYKGQGEVACTSSASHFGEWSCVGRFVPFVIYGILQFGLSSCFN